MEFQKRAALTEKTDWLKELFLIGTIRLPAGADLMNLLLSVKKSLSGGGARPRRILKSQTGIAEFYNVVPA